MRFAVAALAPFALVACYGSPGDSPLSTTIAERADVAPDVTERGGFQLERGDFKAPVRSSETGTHTETPPVEEEPSVDPVMVELITTVSYAREQTFLGATAGQSYDLQAAQAAAIELAFAAEQIAARAHEIRGAFSTSGGVTADCGCGGCEPGVEEPTIDPELDQELDEAVTLSALGAESVAGINDELNPPSETVCTSGGCHTVCEEVPGEIDEPALEEEIEQAIEIANELAAIDLG